jgi:hypothetical protein
VRSLRGWSFLVDFGKDLLDPPDATAERQRGHLEVRVVGDLLELAGEQLRHAP